MKKMKEKMLKAMCALMRWQGMRRLRRAERARRERLRDSLVREAADGDDSVFALQRLVMRKLECMEEAARRDGRRAAAGEMWLAMRMLAIWNDPSRDGCRYVNGGNAARFADPGEDVRRLYVTCPGEIRARKVHNLFCLMLRQWPDDGWWECGR